MQEIARSTEDSHIVSQTFINVMQWAIYTHGKLYGVKSPAIYLLGESTKPREGERRRRSVPEEEAMGEGGRPKLCRPEVEGGLGMMASGLG
jgi:hypothetical protein